MEQLDEARARFAQEIQQQSGIRSAGLIEGLATVPRERFMGPGPWKIVRATAMGKGYQLTPDDDPRHLYQNVLVALDEQRRLNNGEPAGLLLFLDTLDLAPGDRFLHVGCGVGYYTAIASHAVGPQGRVVGVEIDSALAARAAQNLASYRTISVVSGDGGGRDFGTFDAIFVNAGCTRPQARWLEQLAPGGRLLVPMTVSLPAAPGLGAGATLLVRKEEAGYSARFTSPVGIFHCEGARSADEEALLATALGRGTRASVIRLRRDEHEAGPDCWLHASGFCLESDPAFKLRRPAALQLAPETLAAYVGRYQLGPNVFISITLEGDILSAQTTWQPYPVRIYAASEHEFFYEQRDTRITFMADETGLVTGLVLRHGSRDLPSKRIE
jgi:protein-L-isoaspartate(D-aspartate) O-methyltransferase